jgi:hypothetical protein
MPDNSSPADPDLAVMASIPRYKAIVDLMLAPVLRVRTFSVPPCRHAAQAMSPDPDGALDEAPCDCGFADRRAELWVCADLCLKHGLPHAQLRDLAEIVLLKSIGQVDVRLVRGAISDLFAGAFKAKLKRSAQTDDGDAEAPPPIPDHLAA